MLRDKKDIENYEEKAKFLNENGWETWYNDDNWIMTEWREQGKSIDRMGTSTDSAYNWEKGLGDLVQVKSLDEKDFRYRNWTTVRRELAISLKGVQIRELDV
jgi:hypothetical protein